MPSSASYPSLDEIREELLDLDSAQDRLSYLVELGDLVPSFPKEWCIEENRVTGCQSMVWLVSQREGESLVFSATSDAPMVAGLITILMACYQGKTPRQVIDFDVEGFLTEIQLKSFLSPLRSNGLHAMIQRIRQIATLTLANADSNPTPTEIKVLAETKVASKSERPQATRRIDQVRSDFPILARKLENGASLNYLDNAASSQRPESVIETMNQVYRHFYSNAHRSGHSLALEVTVAMEEARKGVQAFINARDQQEVIFTSGSTASINMVARGWGDANLKAGDEILLTEMEHHSNIVPWQQLAQRTGALIRWLPINDRFELDLDQLPNLLTTKTKIIAVTAVSNVLGTFNPIRKICDAAHRLGCRVLVDAAQWVPHGCIDVQAIDADFVVFSGHKILGPTGIGVLWSRLEILETMPPFLGGGGMIDVVSFDGFTLASIPARFEAGTPPSVEAIGLKAAIDYLSSLPEDSILDHERKLVARAESFLRDVPGLHIYGPPASERAGLITFTMEGIHSDIIGRYLDAEGIAIRVGHHCAMPLHSRLGIPVSCRASFYLYNTLEEAEQFGKAVQRIRERFPV